MEKSLIITEKRSVALTYAEILGVERKQDGYMENDNYIITWCVGHLVTLAYPEAYDIALKKWELETLPFLPEEYKYVVIENVKHQFNVVKQLLKSDSVDKIYFAGDPGREGAYIQALVRQKAGVNPNAEEKMIWIDSQTEDEIKRGIKDAKPFSDYNNLISSGYERAIEDYATGINFSRLLTLKYGDLANNAAALEKRKPLSVGRVMSCTLGMIIRREREIENFIPTPFYKISNTITKDGVEIDGEWKVTPQSTVFESPKLYNEKGFKTEADANEFMQKLPLQVKIESIERHTDKKEAPLLFNLAELQSDCSKKFKISPDQTLSVVQSLYEKQMTTYPRTDARVLSSAIAKEITKNLNGLAKFGIEESGYAMSILTNGWQNKLLDSKYTNDSKVTDHYAIIPTGEGLSEYKNLSDLEKAVFHHIVKRFLSIFYPPAEYFRVKMIEKAGNESFIATGRVLVKRGYLEVAGLFDSDNEKNDKVNAIDSLKEGDVFDSTYQISKGETTPPKRYTSGSIILAMENAGQLIEEEELREQIKGTGIGTSSTRGETLKKLVAQEYIRIDKKTQVLFSLPLGNIIYEILELTVPAILNPKMTASWEKGLEQIVNGDITPQKYRKTLEDYVRREASRIKDTDLTGEIKKRILPYAKSKNFDGKTQTDEIETPCPVCGSKLKPTKYGCMCEKYDKDGNGCDFGIGQIAGVTLSAKEIDQLLSTGSLPQRGGFLSKSKKKFTAGLSFSIKRDESGRITEKKLEFVFPPKEEPAASSVPCFKCGTHMKKNTWNYECSCGYKISHTIAGKPLTEKTILELLNTKKTSVIKGFKSKAGKRFDASLKLTDEGKVEFDFAK